MSIDRILIASRGEFAQHLNRVCQRRGIETVAVFSAPDADQSWLDDADYAVYLNDESVVDTYLNPSRIVGAAMDAGADAIHPGYCFLAEHVGFHQLAASANLAVIAPPLRVLATAVDRSTMRLACQALNLPQVPSTAPLDVDDDGIIEAGRMGFPLYVRSESGGTKRLVTRVDDLAGALATVRQVSHLLTGDHRVFLERAIGPHRSLGITVVADQHGNITELGTVESTIQVNYHTWIEELGASLCPQLAHVLGEASIKLARALDWVGIGTVRWAVTPDGGWYLLGFSSRMITGYSLADQVHGVDLVDTQLAIALGEPVAWNQEDARPRRHGIQLRILHYDPSSGRRPPGTLSVMEADKSLGHVERGLELGSSLTNHTEPLLLKGTVTAPTRAAAVVRAKALLDSIRVEGVATNADSLRAIFDQAEFWSGGADSTQVADWFSA